MQLYAASCNWLVLWMFRTAHDPTTSLRSECSYGNPANKRFCLSQTSSSNLNHISHTSVLLLNIAFVGQFPQADHSNIKEFIILDGGAHILQIFDECVLVDFLASSPIQILDQQNSINELFFNFVFVPFGNFKVGVWSWLEDWFKFSEGCWLLWIFDSIPDSVY